MTIYWNTFLGRRNKHMFDQIYFCEEALTYGHQIWLKCAMCYILSEFCFEFISFTLKILFSYQQSNKKLLKTDWYSGSWTSCLLPFYKYICSPHVWTGLNAKSECVGFFIFQLNWCTFSTLTGWSGLLLLFSSIESRKKIYNAW